MTKEDLETRALYVLSELKKVDLEPVSFSEITEERPGVDPKPVLIRAIESCLRSGKGDLKGWVDTANLLLSQRLANELAVKHGIGKGEYKKKQKKRKLLTKLVREMDKEMWKGG